MAIDFKCRFIKLDKYYDVSENNFLMNLINQKYLN